MKINRMFEMVYLLLQKKKITTSELAKYFEVSKRTILRDIEALSMAGIPIYTSKGRNGGISLIENFVLSKRLLSIDEQNQILFGLQSLAVMDSLFCKETLKKMKIFFERQTVDWFSVDFSRWGHQAKDNETFYFIKEAIIGEQAISFVYANTYGKTNVKVVYPLKLLFKAKAWYLQAYCRHSKKSKLYKLSRIHAIEQCKEFFSRKDLISACMPTSTTAVKLVKLTLLFEKEAIFRAYDEFSNDSFEKRTDGRLLVRVMLPEDQWLYSFLLSLGTTARVLAPLHVKTELINQIEATKNYYLSANSDT